jgi:hypothetical protein
LNSSRIEFCREHRCGSPRDGHKFVGFAAQSDRGREHEGRTIS